MCINPDRFYLIVGRGDLESQNERENPHEESFFKEKGQDGKAITITGG